MERLYFELPGGGYLHVYPDALVLTRSGNWGEADRMQERTSAKRIQHLGRVLVGAAIILVAGIVTASHLFGHAGALLFIVASALGVLRMIDRFKHDMARSFRIPFAKVRSLVQDAKGLQVDFVNADLREDAITLRTTEAQGAVVLDAWHACTGRG